MLYTLQVIGTFNNQQKGTQVNDTTRQKLLALFKNKEDAAVLELIDGGFLGDLLSAESGKIDRRKFKVALGLANETAEIRTHRFNVQNLTPDDDIVKEEMEMMEGAFGDVEILSWFCETATHSEGSVLGGGMMPQRVIPVVVRYRPK